ncbi:hypothetical protein [Streptomyces mirabilis]|uniref:hypothetical protein n=1 Tax=Streptomyces mirabilis TaxID=68239 RepID=UPI0033B6F6F9
MQYNKGDRVEYQGQDNQKHMGQVKRIQGQPPQTKYTIQDETSDVEEQVEEQKIERRL